MGSYALWNAIVGRVPDEAVSEAKSILSSPRSERSGRISCFLASDWSWPPTRGRCSSGDISSTAPPQKMRPITDARSITERSSSLSRSRRAVIRALMVGGIVSLDRSSLAVHVPSTAMSKPSSISIRSVSSTKRGFPSAASAIRARASSASSAPPSKLRIKPSVWTSLSERSVMRDAFAFDVIQPPRTSSSSGRARQRKNAGTPSSDSARYSRRSRNVGSAQ